MTNKEINMTKLLISFSCWLYENNLNPAWGYVDDISLNANLKNMDNKLYNELLLYRDYMVFVKNYFDIKNSLKPLLTRYAFDRDIMLKEVYPKKKNQSEGQKSALYDKLGYYIDNVVANHLKRPSEKQYMNNPDRRNYKVEINNPTLYNKLYYILNPE